MSSDRKPAGAINKMHVHTPRTQHKLISSEDFLLITFMIKGILKKGRTIAATNATFSDKGKSKKFSMSALG